MKILVDRAAPGRFSALRALSAMTWRSRSSFRELRRIQPRSFLGRRSRALIVLMYRAGLRNAEVLDLQLSDVDLEAGDVVVRRGKGNKHWIVAFDQRSRDTLRLYLDRRDRYKSGLNLDPQDGNLFLREP